MALGDLMASRFSQLSVAVSNHLEECSNAEEASTATRMTYLPQTIVLCDLRHEAFEGCVPSGPSDSGLVSKWRPKDRMKTGCVALVLCLNISVDPPDVIKISPCARMECWIDPTTMATQKALETIGKTLTHQYERWQPRTVPRFSDHTHTTIPHYAKSSEWCYLAFVKKVIKTSKRLWLNGPHPPPLHPNTVFKLNTDGSVKLNGTASGGGLIRNGQGAWVVGFTKIPRDVSNGGRIMGTEGRCLMQSITGFAISKADMPCKLVVLHPNKCADMLASSFTSATVPISIFNARYKIQLDPTVEEVRKLCTSCRKYAKSERVLFHYNGHGVPMPTANGEIWLFNKSYTQYIPLLVSDLDSWLRTPSIYVFDCSAAGIIVNAFIEVFNAVYLLLLQDWSTSCGSSMRDCILLAACEARETLPQNAEFPADVFTSCLTTPIKMALRWFCTRSLLRESLDYSLIDRIPGRQNDRRTLLGELNWIFTAVTDTIAWNVLPHDLFQRLFRQDLLVASLFRNFLLAERIMRSANCSPVSYPMLPPTHQHHMWDAWDMAAEICLAQLPTLVEDPNADFQPSPFFTEQLTAFEVWLDHGSEHKKPPEQLPIVLQALSVGIFPYVLKLLQTTTPELRQILVFIWTKILALDKSCQVDLVKDGGHTYFIRFLDSMEAYPEQRAMAAFVLAVIVDGHRRGQEACIEAGLIHVCLNHLQSSAPNDAQTEPLFLQWLCLCLGKLWEDFTEAQIIGLQADAPAIYAPLLSEPQAEVRASAVFALGTLLDVGFASSRDSVVGDEEFDDDEKVRAEISIVKSLLSVVSDGSPLVRAEIAVALARFAFGHNKHLKSIAAAYGKPQSNTVINSLSSLNIKCSGSGYTTPTQYLPHGSTGPSQIGPLLRVGADNQLLVRDGRISTSSPLATSGLMHGSPLSDDSSQRSGSGILNDCVSNGVVHHTGPRPLDNALYSQCILAMFTLAKDPSPRIASLGRRVLSIIGIEQKVVTKSVKPSSSSFRPGESPIPTPSLAGLARSSSWFDMNGVKLVVIGFVILDQDTNEEPKLRTPPVSPPRPSYLSGMRRVCSLEFRPHLMNPPDNGLADPLLGSGGASVASEPINKLHNQIASWDTKFESGTKTILLQPFSPVVIAADETERIRIWNYEEDTLLNSFDNHDFPEKGISKLCLLNELDDSLLLAASCDGNIRIWKDYTSKGNQKLVTAFSSVQGHRSGGRSVNAVVDWQQQSGYLYASGENSSIMVWDLDKELLVNSVPSSSDCSISALSSSQVHAGQFAAGFVDGYVRLFDIRTPEFLVCATRPHTQRVERVVGIGFQPGLDPAKIVSASQAGDIQFLDIRCQKDTYLTIDAHRGSLTALVVHRHAPIIASGSAKQLIKVFNLEGEQLGSIRYYPTFMAQRIGSVSCLTFHPYQVLLAAGAADACVSIYADEISPLR
ncbi:regulatory-associated protein of TOR 1 [Actinidia rufa]|uniref:Regulatory-associated protein of TOR 1 n=1 Tax=Actinidia rufa TaxID=165716 RepID=A0A7J0DPR0_9ERIC|nr:regulatory-associated protein of TOR 1 [Actinidia rufa]